MEPPIHPPPPHPPFLIYDFLFCANLAFFLPSRLREAGNYLLANLHLYNTIPRIFHYIFLLSVTSCRGTRSWFESFFWNRVWTRLMVFYSGWKYVMKVSDKCMLCWHPRMLCVTFQTTPVDGISFSSNILSRTHPKLAVFVRNKRCTPILKVFVVKNFQSLCKVFGKRFCDAAFKALFTHKM